MIAFAILAMPIGATAAFTSASAIPDIPAQWGIATAFLVVAWLLRPMVTAVFGQLAFLRLYSGQTGNR
ncbi:hypothetical protein thalar_02515 [Litoreibacter arenae DSM 19593]|uniref:Uncharacterized protein n=1 Tax=Litoreibacter arenae DSM 19593 TaxID=1123360 RepID=S9QA85_9RHOB|nr:hypothetical protein thalar_02515 [Litoreibacter arenae DSM 19593]